MSVLQGPCVSMWGHAPPERPGLSPGLLISLCSALLSRAFMVQVNVQLHCGCPSTHLHIRGLQSFLLTFLRVYWSLNLFGLLIFCTFKKFCPFRASLEDQQVKSLLAMWETQVRSPGQEDPLEKGMVTHSSTLT